MLLEGEAAVWPWLRDTLGCEQAARARLEKFVAMLREENQHQNLVAAASLDQVWVRHIADSAQLLAVPRGTPGYVTPGPWLDLGTGAGFPGLVIALLDPAREVVLVESRTKRIAWLESVIGTFGLTRTRVMGMRLEVVTRFPAAVISARAFAPLQQIIATASRFSTQQTCWMLPKGRNGAKELGEMSKTIQSMFHVEHSITDPESVILIGHGEIRTTGAGTGGER